MQKARSGGEQDQEQGRCDGGRSGGVGKLLRTGWDRGRKAERETRTRESSEVKGICGQS